MQVPPAALRRISLSLASVALLGPAACGKKEGPPAAATSPATVAPATTGPATAPATAAPATAAPTPTTAPAAAPDAGAAPSGEADAAPAVTSDDLLVWTDTGGSATTVWLHGDAVVATRPEIVTVADGKLWALGTRFRETKVYPCKEGDSGEGDHSQTPSTEHVPVLAARELGAAATVDLADAYGSDVGDAFDGELSGGSASLLGAIGTKVFVDTSSSLYACGAAHGQADDSAAVIDLVTKEQAPVTAPETLQQKVVAALRVAGKENDCIDDDAELTPVPPDTLALRVKGGKALAAWLVERPSDAEWNHICDLSAEVPVPFDDTLGFGAIDPRVIKTVEAQPKDANFGFAVVPASLPAERREALLALFRDTPASFKPAPDDTAKPAEAGGGDAKALLNQGRKLTLKKDFAGAIQAFDAAIAADAKLAAAYSGRGYAKLQAGDDTAQADFEKALTLETKDVHFQAAVWFNLGHLAEKKKDLAAAKKAYAKVLELKPSDAVKKALARVSK